MSTGKVHERARVRPAYGNLLLLKYMEFVTVQIEINVVDAL